MKASKQKPVITSDSQMQMLMNEFEKQRDMFMKLCENQNALLSGSLEGLSADSMATEASQPQQVAPQSAPQPVAPAAVESVPEVSSADVSASSEPLFEESILQQMSEPEPAAESVVEPAAAPDIAPSADAGSGTQERPKDLFQYIASLMANVLEMHVDDIDPDQNIMEFGADSMTALSLVKEVETTYSLELPATLLFEYSTLNELVDYLKSEIGEA